MAVLANTKTGSTLSDPIAKTFWKLPNTCLCMQVFIHNSAFASNTAKPPPLVDGYMGLNGFEKENDTMSSLPCSGGEGGAICIRGSAGAVITVSSRASP